METESHISKLNSWLQGFEIIKNYGIEKIIKGYYESNDKLCRKLERDFFLPLGRFTKYERLLKSSLSGLKSFLSRQKSALLGLKSAHSGLKLAILSLKSTLGDLIKASQHSKQPS